MLKSAIKSLLAHKTRMALSTLAIVLGVAFIAGTYIYTDTTNEAFGGIFDDAYVGIDVIVSGDSERSRAKSSAKRSPRLLALSACNSSRTTYFRLPKICAALLWHSISAICSGVVRRMSGGRTR